MAKKSLTVPQAGTQPASIPSPMENMLNGVIPTVEKPTPAKKSVNFLCDADLFKEFKLYCTRHGVTMTKVFEEAMTNILKADQMQ
ncbi:MAG: hypothetical protein NC453_17230 [Muribaculum sp.]|nr:hypothetical protein [Muribaculum sp.]